MISFQCALPTVKEQFPIIKSKNYRFQWAKDAAQAYKEAVVSSNAVTGVAKCPGIIDMCSAGYILNSWFDISILTSNDPITFQYRIPPVDNCQLDLLKWFSNDVPQVRTPLPTNSLQTLLKITTPWSVNLPEDWSLLILPIPYPDEPDFECTAGILKGAGTYEINPIIKCHRRPGTLNIPAGTPLCQLIPIKNELPLVEII